MNTFKTLISKLDTVLRKYNLSEYEKLQLPLTDKEIDKSLQELGINDENIKALFQWKNGEKEDSYCQMTERGGLMSLDAVKESKLHYNFYDPFLIALITDNGEESLLFNTKPGLHYGKLYLFSVSQLYIDHPIGYFDSLEAMVKTIIEAYNKKALFYDKEEEFLEYDGPKFREIAKKINKKSAYWTNHDPLREEEWYEI